MVLFRVQFHRLNGNLLKSELQFVNPTNLPAVDFSTVCPFNRDKISSFLIRVLNFHDFYLDNTIYKMA